MVLQENLLGEPDFYCDLLQFYFSFDRKEDSVSTKATVSFCNSHDLKTAKTHERQKNRLHFCPWILLTKVQLKPASSFPLSVSLTAFALPPLASGGRRRHSRPEVKSQQPPPPPPPPVSASWENFLPPSSLLFSKKAAGDPISRNQSSGEGGGEKRKEEERACTFFYSPRIQTPLLFSSSYSSPHKKRNTFTPRFLEQHDLFPSFDSYFPFRGSAAFAAAPSSCLEKGGC